MFRIQVGVVVVAGLGVLGGSVQAQESVNLAPSKDGTLYEPLLDGLVSNGSGAFIYSGVIRDGKIRRAVLEFDLSAIPAGATVTGVTLRMTVTRAVFGEFEVGLHRAGVEWGEGTSNAGEPGGQGTTPAAGDVTWEHAFFPSVLWATPGGDFASTPSSSSLVGDEGAYTWPSTPELVADVQGWLDDPGTNHGWVVRHADEETTFSARRFGSRESPAMGDRPRLTVTYVLGGPECPADWDGNGVVNAVDVSEFLNDWFTDQAAGTLVADWDGNGVVNAVDVSEFFNAFFSSPTECVG